MSGDHVFPASWRRGVYEAIARRRDMRSFLADPVPPPVLARILAAAHRAGSVGFMQPWDFLVVEDIECRRRLRAHVDQERKLAAEDFEGDRRERYLSLKLEGILEAPLGVCVTCDPTRNGPAVLGRHTIRETDVYSTCCAIQNLWLAARAEGIGVGWVSILRPPALREILGIPENVIPVAYLCLGYVEDFPDRPGLETAGWLPRLPLAEVVHAGTWGAAPPGALAPELAPAFESAGAAGAAGAAGVEPASGDATRERGLLVVYTGQGKGKTTAALGIVFRALGHARKVAVVQFIKGKWMTGERRFAQEIPELEFHVMGKGFTWESDDLTRDRLAARAAWEKSKEFLAAGTFDIVVLDELTYAVSYGFVPLDEILEALRARPSHVHAVVTGRNAPEPLIEMADLVTEMRLVKHPFEKGVRASRGLDY